MVEGAAGCEGPAKAEVGLDEGLGDVFEGGWDHSSLLIVSLALDRIIFQEASFV